ncbi:hypothetical protein OO015_13755 (plasmid) [Thermomicrobium sp. 4228-Ro]|uniref:hypothetical protein n=1 Tax=Thermomicrobium sp. 4228-Ro TaxID=2993937 RepID=UPI002248E818|nr:hypothetical protein [Thermomicrobium sp. 4228-Ro]MCX2728550.1 hypothetical protein [Thermomicrobium sp. 4228-Ro]
MDATAARTYAIGELGRIAEHLGWTDTHPQVQNVLADVEDVAGVPIEELDDREARALIRALAWRRAVQALAAERAVALPLGGGSLANEQLYEHAREQAAVAWNEWLIASGQWVVSVEEVYRDSGG